MPSQMSSDSNWSPATRLAGAVLGQTLMEIRDHFHEPRYRRRISQDLAWVDSNDRRWPYSFVPLRTPSARSGVRPEPREAVDADGAASASAPVVGTSARGLGASHVSFDSAAPSVVKRPQLRRHHTRALWIRLRSIVSSFPRSLWSTGLPSLMPIIRPRRSGHIPLGRGRDVHLRDGGITNCDMPTSGSRRLVESCRGLIVRILQVVEGCVGPAL